MQYLKEMWAVIAAAVMAWLSHINNYTLDTIIKLLTILVFVIGLADWTVRRVTGKRKKKKTEGEEASGGRQVLDMVESTQKPFKTVSMLENPMQSGESIGNFVDKISHQLLKGGTLKMKKFFKWLWYNKEQLFSIAYSVAIIAFTQFVIWTDLLSAIFPELAATPALVVKIIAGVFSVAFTVLTVRNVCVPYGLSSLDTIDKHLAKKAEEAASKLSPERKKELKSYISTLQATLSHAKTDLATAEKALAEITTLYNADSSLVMNFSARKKQLDDQIAQVNAVIANVETRIAEYKAELEDKNIKQ